MSHHHSGGTSGGMSGMDMVGDDLFQPTNSYITTIYWSLIAAVIGVGFIGNVAQRIVWHSRREAILSNTIANPTVPFTVLAQSYATVRTLLRELSYPQPFVIKSRLWSWLTPPPLGRCLLVLAYWITITIMLTTNAITTPKEAYYFERIGFRAAWVGLAQVPLIILLAGKVNIVGILVGSSYERLNWAHRWASRTLLVTIAVHGGFFLRQFIRADYLEEELSFMPIIRYGMGAGGVLLWMNLSGLAPLRHLWYEFWVVQHLASIAVFLWLLYLHTPVYTRQFVWMSIAFIAFDRIARLAWLFYRNVHFRGGLRLADRIGYRTELHSLPGQITRVILHDVPFEWSAGQHIYIWLPIVGFIETHPFTISNIASRNGSDLPSAQLEIRAHSGFSRRLHRLALKCAASGNGSTLRSLIQGPFGTHPDWQTYDSLVLVSASTGASFTLPILETILADPVCVRTVHYLLMVRERPQCSCYLHRLRMAARDHGKNGLTVRIHVAVTQATQLDKADVVDGEIASQCCCGPNSPSGGCVCGSDIVEKNEHLRDDRSSSNPDDTISCCAQNPAPTETKATVATSPSEATESPKHIPARSFTAVHSLSSSHSSSTHSLIDDLPATSRDVAFLHGRRPKLDRVIRRTVEQARGETMVVVCGGTSLSSHVRNVVAALSDERAVHKGTGAQGVGIWTEEFGF